MLQASVRGSLDLLALSGTGAVLSYLGHFSATISSSLSNGSCAANTTLTRLYRFDCVLTLPSAVYKIFLPALVLASILETVDHGLTGNIGSLQEVWVPLAAGVLIFIITAIVAHPPTLLLVNGKEEAVRRVIWICIVLGNSNTVELLVMQSICDSFSPLKEDPTSLVRSTGYASFYIAIRTIFTVRS